MLFAGSSPRHTLGEVKPVNRRVLAVVAAVLIGGTSLAGCSASSSAGDSASPATPSTPTLDATSSPGGSKATLATFDDQRLSWHECYDGLACTDLLVPLDYAKPAGKTIHIAVIRQKASGTPEGSLIINPGGPGASGVTFLAEAGGVFDQLRTHFDLVSFDPRGVGGSDPIRCLTGPQLDAYVNVDPDPTTAAQREAREPYLHQ